jgi:hypothetical protein
MGRIVSIKWSQLDLRSALAEETSNHGAQIPEYRARGKRYKEVLKAMQNCGFNFRNFQTLQCRFDRLMEDIKKGSRAKISGVEGDEVNPLDLLLEDMVMNSKTSGREGPEKEWCEKQGSSTCS